MTPHTWPSLTPSAMNDQGPASVSSLGDDDVVRTLVRVPQHAALPLVYTPHVCVTPPLTWDQLPATVAGLVTVLVVPTPICPLAPLPQHFKLPSEKRVHVWESPAVACAQSI